MENELLDDFQTSTGSKKMRQASFGKRLLATGIDSFIFMGIFMLFSDLLIDATGNLFVYNNYLTFLSFAMIIFYIALAESSAKQGTLGKQFLKIKVVDKQGKRITFIHALGRLSIKLALSPILLIAFMSRNKDRQDGGILDTYVIETKLELDE